MNLKELIDFVDNNPKSYAAPGAYIVLDYPEITITAEMGGNRAVRIIDNKQGVQVFRGSSAGISVLEAGDWQEVLKSKMDGESVSVPAPSIQQNMTAPQNTTVEDQISKVEEVLKNSGLHEEVAAISEPEAVEAQPSTILEQDIFSIPPVKHDETVV